MRLNLKLFRTKQKLTQSEMAKKMGVNRGMYAQVEKGSRSCTPTFLKKLQDAFNIPDEEMWSLTKLEGEE